MKYIKLFKESIEWDNWEQPIKKYRISGSDCDYTEKDIIDINDTSYNKLKETFEENNINYSIKEMLTYDAELYALDCKIIDGKIVKNESKYSCYLDAILKDIKNERGATIYKSSFKLWEYNDGSYNVTLNNNNFERSYVCFGWEGLSEFFKDTLDIKLPII
jgi:hypothetical protein